MHLTVPYACMRGGGSSGAGVRPVCFWMTSRISVNLSSPPMPTDSVEHQGRELIGSTTPQCNQHDTGS